MKKRFALLLLIGLSGASAWLVWFRPVKGEEEEKKPEALVSVHVAKIGRATVRHYVAAFGVIEPEPTASAHLAPSVPGVITAVHCIEGQRVESGSLLFELDGRASEVAVRFAQKTLDRQRKLAETDGTSLKALQEAEQQWASAHTQQELLQVRSPIAGTVSKLNVRVGEAADLTTSLAEIVDLGRLVATLSIPGESLESLKVGQTVELTRPDSTNHPMTTLTFVGPQIDPKTGSGLVRARIPMGLGLAPGQFIKARIVSEERTQRLVVPLASVARDPSGSDYIALVEGDKAVLKPVQVGFRDGNQVEVEGEGVEADKTVVTEGAYGLIMTQQFATRIQVIND
jgi:RND family efflux transporter MFP subunit